MHVLSDPIAQLLGPWAAETGPWCAVFRVALAVLLAAVIGWERSSKRHSAGLRTFMLISLAGCAAAYSISRCWMQISRCSRRRPSSAWPF